MLARPKRVVPGRCRLCSMTSVGGFLVSDARTTRGPDRLALAADNIDRPHDDGALVALAGEVNQLDLRRPGNDHGNRLRIFGLGAWQECPQLDGAGLEAGQQEVPPMVVALGSWL